MISPQVRASARFASTACITLAVRVFWRRCPRGSQGKVIETDEDFAAAVLAACAGVAGMAQGQGGAAPATQGGAQGQPAGPPPGMPKPETLSSRPAATRGEALYVQHCAMCHGPNGMGTGLLGRRIEKDYEENLY